MKISKEKLQELRGLMPCGSSVRFTPACYSSFLDDRELREVAPVFVCRPYTTEELERAKEYTVDFTRALSEKSLFKNKKDRLLSCVKGNITDWENLVNLETGKEFKYSEENVDQLPEVVLESLLAELCKYAGIGIIGIRRTKSEASSNTDVQQ